MSKVIYDSPTIQVIEWREGSQGVLIGPPDSGHGDGILDYGPGQSIIEQALLNTAGGVHHIKWKGATQATKGTSIQHKVWQTVDAMSMSNSRHLVGLCQAGCLFARVATEYATQVHSLTVAGAPIDTSLGESVLSKAQEIPIECYRWVVAMNGGIMPGWLMNMCWSVHNRERRYIDWHNKTQNLAGEWYLEFIEELFLNNTFKDTLDITCPVFIAAGERDVIVPPAQTWAINKVAHASKHYYSCNADHFEVFMGYEARPMWADIFKQVGQQ